MTVSSILINYSRMKNEIKDISRFSASFQTRKGVEPCPDGTHCLLQIRDFDKARSSVNVAQMARVSPSSVDREMCLLPGDVVFLAKGARNFAYAIDESFPPQTLASSYFFVLRLTSEVLSAYVAWYLNQEPARRYFARMATTGAHMPIVRRDVLANFEIALPDRATQQRIVDLDGLARHQQSLLDDLARKKRELTTAACLRAANEFSPST